MGFRTLALQHCAAYVFATPRRACKAAAPFYDGFDWILYVIFLFGRSDILFAPNCP